MFQFFEWNLANDGTLWKTLADNAGNLREKGVTAVWFPPASKGEKGGSDVGYGSYDLFDLGEFDQKGSVRTKYGTKEELLAAVAAVQAHEMDAYLDVVMNHRIGGDETEEVEVVQVEQGDRLKEVGAPYVIKAWSKYTFPGRKGKYSDFVWTKDQFTAFGADANHQEEYGKIYRVKDKSFAGDVDGENGNFDYLMGADVDLARAEVREELVKWGGWLLETTKARGLRIDAAKHMSNLFAKDWLAQVRATRDGHEVFAVGEYWSGATAALEGYLDATEDAMRLFDVPLHYRMKEAADKGRDFDLRTLLDGTLVKENPVVAVTFVDNHDSQPGAGLQSPVADWFKPIAYAFILLRNDGYPCVFYGDYFGNDGSRNADQKLTAHRVVIDAMLAARQKFLFGELHDHFESETLVGWLSSGDDAHPGVMAVAISTAEASSIWMDTGRPGQEFKDVTGGHEQTVRAGDDGRAEFLAPAGAVSVWCST